MFIRMFLGILLHSMSWIGDVLVEQLFVDIGQEEEGLDEGVEVASVSDILEAHRHPFLPLSLVQCKWLSL